jgi:hypothetical protein
MSDPENLAYYTQLVEFRADPSLAVRHFESPNKSRQRVLQSLSHAMGLDYEYSRATRTVTIAREIRLASPISPKTEIRIPSVPVYNKILEKCIIIRRDFGPQRTHMNHPGIMEFKKRIQ